MIAARKKISGRGPRGMHQRPRMNSIEARNASERKEPATRRRSSFNASLARRASMPRSQAIRAWMAGAKPAYFKSFTVYVYNDGRPPPPPGRKRAPCRPPQGILATMTILPPSRFFPPAESADAEGVVGFGGELSPEWLLDAYQHGIFPWPTGDPTLPVPWCSPDPRAIIQWDRFHVPRRLGNLPRRQVSRDVRRRFCRGHSRLRDRGHAARANLAHATHDPCLHAAARVGALPQRGGLARRRAGRRGATDWRSGGCSRPNRCFIASATPRRWPWCI